MKRQENKPSTTTKQRRAELQTSKRTPATTMGRATAISITPSFPFPFLCTQLACHGRWYLSLMSYDVMSRDVVIMSGDVMPCHVTSCLMMSPHLAAERRQATAFSLDELPQSSGQQPEVRRRRTLLHLHRLVD